MKQRIQLFGAIALLALIVGAFLLPSTPAQAAAATTYQRTLPGRPLLNERITTIATIPFRTRQQGSILLTTSQEANLGFSTFDDYSSVYNSLTIFVILDGKEISNKFITASSSGSPLVPIGVQIHDTILPGHHVILLDYVSDPLGLGIFTCPILTTCRYPTLSGGSLTLNVM